MNVIFGVFVFLLYFDMKFMQLIYNFVVLEYDIGLYLENRKWFEVMGELLEIELIDGAFFLLLVYIKDYIKSIKFVCEFG